MIATPSARSFIDSPGLNESTGHPVRSEYKQPDEADVLPPPDAIVVAPATFNTINKWAAGISDTLALGLLTEGIGKRLPVVALPFVNAAQAEHPAFEDSIDRLRAAGVQLLYGPDVLELHAPGTGSQRVALFPWQLTLKALDASHARRPSTGLDREARQKFLYHFKAGLRAAASGGRPRPSGCPRLGTLLTSLPGLRELRAPLAAGYLWLITAWIALASKIPTPEAASGVLKDIYRLGQAVGKPGVIAAVTFAAYIIGIVTQRMARLAAWPTAILPVIRARSSPSVKLESIRRPNRTDQVLLGAIVDVLIRRYWDHPEFRIAVLRRINPPNARHIPGSDGPPVGARSQPTSPNIRCHG